MIYIPAQYGAYTDSEKEKLKNVGENAQENVIEKISVNGIVQPITNKEVALTIIDNTVNDLVNYYRKSETYTQAEINALVNTSVSGGFLVVSELPTTDISTKNIYLLRKQNTKVNNIYDEYINVTGDSTGWEIIGDTTIDLSEYVTKTELESAGYVTDAELTTAINGLVTGVAMSSALEAYVRKDELSTLVVTGVKGSQEADFRGGDVNITKANIGLGNVGNFLAVSTASSQGLTEEQQANARNNIGAFDGNYNNLSNKPDIPVIAYSDQDLIEGESVLKTGSLYFVYE